MDKLDIREMFASYAHDAWSRWVRHVFGEAMIYNPDGTITISTDAVDRRLRLANTPYNELSEKEKDSDRVEADKILDIMIEGLRNIIEDGGQDE